MKTTYRVGIISDTHNLLRDEVITLLNDCDYIIHGGDINSPDILQELNKIAKIPPVIAVRGNNDIGDWANALEVECYFNIGGINFYMVHDKESIPKDLSGIDVVIFGHSHRYHYNMDSNVLWLNPGSCGKKRFHLPLTMVIMEIVDSTYSITKHNL